HRREDVPPGEGGAGGGQVEVRVGQVDRTRGAADHGHRGGQQAVVGPHEHRHAVAHLDRDGTAVAADARVDHRQHHPGAEVLRAAGEEQAPGPHVVGGDVVGEVDDPDAGRDRPDHRVDDADELVGPPVV